MINLKHYRENPDIYIQWCAAKRVIMDREQFNVLDGQVRDLKFQIDECNAQRNTASASIQKLEKWGPDFLKAVSDVKILKEQIATLEALYAQAKAEFDILVLRIPAPPLAEVPVWWEEDNKVIKLIGTMPTYDFNPQAHDDILTTKWYLDMERAVKLSGSRFAMLKGKMVQLQLALQQFVLMKLIKKWFTPVMVPFMVKEWPMLHTWYLPDAENWLYVVNPGEDDYYLIGTSEVPLISQHSGEVLDLSNGPIRYVWLSSCFRREAGSYGKDTKWLIRVHQFEKVEMVSFCKPEDASKEHELLFAIENEIFTDLWLHYQQILIASWDLWWPAAKKYDLEAWFPSQQAYREVTSTSNTVDYQARRANIKYQTDEGKEFVYSLNGTACALWRALACIVEQYQTAEWDVIVPEVLRDYMGCEKF